MAGARADGAMASARSAVSAATMRRRNITSPEDERRPGRTTRLALAPRSAGVAGGGGARGAGWGGRRALVEREGVRGWPAPAQRDRDESPATGDHTRRAQRPRDAGDSRPAPRRRDERAQPREPVLADVVAGQEREQQDERGRRQEDVAADARRALDDREQHRQGGKPQQDALIATWHGSKTKDRGPRCTRYFPQRSAGMDERPGAGRSRAQAARRKRPDRRSTSNHTLQPRSAQSQPQRLPCVRYRRTA